MMRCKISLRSHGVRGIRAAHSMGLSPRLRGAFTLLELLTTTAIIGLMVGLALPAVQNAREAARRSTCSNNLHNQVLALHSYHALRNEFPAGRLVKGGMETSWCLEILPHCEQGALAGQYDRSQPWGDPANNLAVANTSLSLFRCPSSNLKFEGDTDYGGMMGSILSSASWAGSLGNGVLIEVGTSDASPVSISGITDGTSQTICLVESTDRDPLDGGRWISGFNLVSHDSGAVSAFDGGEIFSLHRTGAYVTFADGAVKYLRSSVESKVIGALCTRNLGETVDADAY